MAITVNGTAIGGRKSNLVLPEYKVVMDIGVATEESMGIATVCVTHAHIDHLGGAVHHAATRSLTVTGPSLFLVPHRVAPGLDGILNAWRKLQGNFDYQILPIGPGESYTLPSGVIIRPFRTDHVLPSQGYALCREVKKLKPEFQGLAGNQIRDLRLSGVEVSSTVENVEVAYTGDTRISAYDREPLMRNARFLIHEATFINDSIDRAGARRHGHTHLDEIAERADEFQNESLMLCHFSPRYTKRDIMAAIGQLPANLKAKTTPWLD